MALARLTSGLNARLIQARRQLVWWCLAALAGLVAAFFLLLAAYSALAREIGAPLAALAIGLALLVLSGIFALIAGRQRRYVRRVAPMGAAGAVDAELAGLAARNPGTSLIAALVAGVLYEQFNRRR